MTEMINYHQRIQLVTQMSLPYSCTPSALVSSSALPLHLQSSPRLAPTRRMRHPTQKKHLAPGLDVRSRRDNGSHAGFCRLTREKLPETDAAPASARHGHPTGAGRARRQAETRGDGKTETAGERDRRLVWAPAESAAQRALSKQSGPDAGFRFQTVRTCRRQVSPTEAV